MQASTAKQNQSKKPVAGANGKAPSKGKPPVGHALQGLQRAIGNQAMQQVFLSDAVDGHGSSASSSSDRMVSLPGRGMTHPLAAAMAQPGVRFRVPEFSKVKSAYTDKDLKIPEAVIKSRVTQLLERMKKDGRLKSADSVADIVNKIFPAPGVIDESEFNKAIDVADRSRIYKDVAEADTTVKAADKPKLQAAMKEAGGLINTVKTDTAGLKQVFGSKDTDAKTNYDNAQKALDKVVKNMDRHVTTDYNLDDPEVNLEGWANFDSQRMHLLLEVAQVKDLKETKVTVIHEATHFANRSVDDQVYYADAGFFEAPEDKKVANAAHYEELPRRVMGTSKFDKKTFTPGGKPEGGAVTREDKVKAAADLYLRHAWDAAVDAHTLIRWVRREYEAGNTKPFNDKKALILEISKLMDLTIHEQAAGKQIVTTLDVTLSESVARAVGEIWGNASRVPFPSTVEKKTITKPERHVPWYHNIPVFGILLDWIFGGPSVRMKSTEVSRDLTDDELRDKMVQAAIAKYGVLLKDPTRDKALLDWLAAHYHAVL